MVKLMVEGLNKNVVIGLFVAGLIIYAFSSGVFNSVTGNSIINSVNGDITVEVVHFHATQQCYSCIRVGELAEGTVNQLNNPKIIMKHVNVDLSENRDIVNKYGARGSAIMIGLYNGDSFHKEENINVWYKLNDPKGFYDYFSDLLIKRLNGDLS